jgi:hypothetical protein
MTKMPAKRYQISANQLSDSVEVLGSPPGVAVGLG